jgi:Flp pilus assembly protein TadD
VSLALLVLALGALSAWAWFHKRAERQEALRAAEAGNFAEAEPHLLRATLRDPRDTAVIRALALGYLKSERLHDAELYFARWCELQPNDAEPFKRRLLLWAKLSHLLSEAEDAQRALQLEPDNRGLRLYLPMRLFTIGKVDEAERECQRSLKMLQGDPWLLLLQADIHGRRGRLEAATALLDQLAHDYPEMAEVFMVRASLHLNAGQPAEAVQWFQFALTIPGPHHARALYDLGLALARSGKTEEAERTLKQALAIKEQELWSVYQGFAKHRAGAGPTP